MKDKIEEAKQKYPIGTKFNPAHVRVSNAYCIITDDTTIKSNDRGDIIAYTGCFDNSESDRWCSHDNLKYGNTNLDRVLYDKETGKWAKIMFCPEAVNNSYVNF